MQSYIAEVTGRLPVKEPRESLHAIATRSHHRSKSDCHSIQIPQHRDKPFERGANRQQIEEALQRYEDIH